MCETLFPIILEGRKYRVDAEGRSAQRIKFRKPIIIRLIDKNQSLRKSLSSNIDGGEDDV